MVEQDCPYPDLDGRDLEATTRHVVLLEDDELVGCLRVLDDGEWARIGRVVVAQVGTRSRSGRVLMTRRWRASGGARGGSTRRRPDGVLRSATASR